LYFCLLCVNGPVIVFLRLILAAISTLTSNSAIFRDDVWCS
jgi:hypothetical protein